LSGGRRGAGATIDVGAVSALPPRLARACRRSGTSRIGAHSSVKAGIRAARGGGNGLLDADVGGCGSSHSSGASIRGHGCRRGSANGASVSAGVVCARVLNDANRRGRKVCSHILTFLTRGARHGSTRVRFAKGIGLPAATGRVTGKGGHTISTFCNRHSGLGALFACTNSSTRASITTQTRVARGSGARITCRHADGRGSGVDEYTCRS